MVALGPRSKFMLCIGEEGTILLFFKNGTLSKRYFAKNKNSNAIPDIRDCLATNKEVPLYLVLNNIKQDYLLQYVPDVNRLGAYLAVKTEIEHFACTYDISSAILIEKPSEPNQNWCYLYVLAKVKHLIEYWLNVFVEIGSNFKGILMFSMEISSITRKILHKNNAAWNIVVASTKTGGYRQLVMKHNKIVFTNLMSSTGDNLSGIIAGRIYQEVKNIIQSLSKFGFKVGDPIDLCMIVQEDIKTSLSVINFSENSVSIFTPYELSKLLKLDLAITEKDKFCDTIIMFNSFRNREVAVFNTKETKEFYLLNALHLHSPRFFLFFILTLTIVDVLCVLNLVSNMHIADNLIIKEQSLNNELITLRQNNIVKEVNEINNFIDINNMLSQIEYSPLTQIQYVEKLKVFDTVLKTFEWSYDEISNSITTKLKFHLKLDADIFDRYYNLQDRLNSNFRTQTVSISSLPPFEEKHDVAVHISIEEKM